MKRPAYILPMLLASCGTLPEPFYGDPGKQAVQLAAPAAPVLVIPTPTGAMLNQGAATAYANDLAGALNAIDIPSIARPALPTDWLLTTTAHQAANTVIPDYAIVGPGGKTYGNQPGGPLAAAAWTQGDPAALNAQAASDALLLSKALAAVNSQVQQSNPNSLENRPPRVFMGSVTGAPGDGDASLALNMTRDLPSPQTELVQSPANADFTISGIVKTQPDAHNQVLVELDWIVTDSAKRQIGQVTQLHDLDPSDIEPAWGDVAAAAAAEAASGVNQVIANATLKKANRGPAIANGPLAGGMSLVIPPEFALPAPGPASTELAAFTAPTPVPVEVASISEPLPVPPAAARATAPAELASAVAAPRPAPARPAAAPVMLAAATPERASFNPFAAIRLAASTLFGHITGILAAPAQEAAAQPTEIAPTEAAYTPSTTVPAVTVQPTVFIVPVQASPLPPVPADNLAAEYDAIALVTPVRAVPLPPPAPIRRVTRLAAFHPRFARPAPARVVALPPAPLPALPGLTAISDSQLWRVAAPIPLSFGPPAQYIRELVYIVPTAAQPARVTPLPHLRLHVRLADFRPAAASHPRPMTLPVIKAAAQPRPIPAFVAALITPPPAVPQAPAFKGPIESNYDVLER